MKKFVGAIHPVQMAQVLYIPEDHAYATEEHAGLPKNTAILIKMFVRKIQIPLVKKQMAKIKIMGDVYVVI